MKKIVIQMLKDHRQTHPDVKDIKEREKRGAEREIET
jgi:hypothetical protein